MAEEKEKPLTRKDVLRLIKENIGTAKGLDLSGKVFKKGIDLRKLDLEGIILKGADLEKANLEGANLSAANLEGAVLQEAHLEGAILQKANLVGAFMRDIYLKGAFLNNTHLEKANLWKAHLEKAFLDHANLKKADLHEANLEGANLSVADLEGADLSSTKLEGTLIHRANITEAHLGETDWGNYVIGEEKIGMLDIAEHRYRQLKMWYTNSGYHDIAAKFYYREKEAGRKALKWRSKLCHHRLALEASHIFFGYGERWRNILFWIAVVIFGLAGAYHLWGSFCSSSFLDTLYYSAVSFTALGYGQWAPQPTGWAKGAGAVEAVIGVFMMALLLVTFVRKWTR